MDDFQRAEAIAMLLAQTEVDEEEIEEYGDLGLEMWLAELGYFWNPAGGYGMGAWESAESGERIVCSKFYVEGNRRPMWQVVDTQCNRIIYRGPSRLAADLTYRKAQEELRKLEEYGKH